MEYHQINVNIIDSLPTKAWEEVQTVYEQMPGWLGFGHGGDLGELNIPYWFGFDPNEKHVSASVEPSGLQIFALMEKYEWLEWIAKFKQKATTVLGFKVGEIETGEVQPWSVVE